MIAMAMVRLRVKRGFRDLEANRYRPTGGIFEVSEDRAQVIVAAGVAEIVEVLAAPDAADKPAPEESPKERRGKRRKG